MAEGIAVDRFGWRLVEEWMRQHARNRGLVDCACGRGTSVVILRLPGAQAHEVVDQRIAWTGVERDQVIAVDERHIGDAAEIEHANGMTALEHSHHGTVEHRDHRRALSSGGDIGGAEIVNHRNTQPSRERGSIAELHGQPAVGPVHDGLAMEPHYRHLLRRHAVCRQEGFDGVRMNVGHQFLRLDEDCGSSGALSQIGSGGDRAPQDLPLLLAIGPIPGRAEASDLLTVGIDQGHIHPVIGGAAHQADGSVTRHCRCPR